MFWLIFMFMLMLFMLMFEWHLLCKRWKLLVFRLICPRLLSLHCVVVVGGGVVVGVVGVLGVVVALGGLCFFHVRSKKYFQGFLT